VSGSTRTSAAVDSQLSQEEAGKASAGVDDDVGSESEPEAPTGNLDPVDSELNFRRHSSAWRLWAARLERWHATERASGPTTATAQPIVAEPRVPQVRFRQRCQPRRESVLNQGIGPVGPSWPLPNLNPLWRNPGFPKCGFPCSNHSRLPTATWIGFAPAIGLLVCRQGQPRRYQGGFPCFAGSQERALLAFCGLSR
jgi:hypothetical protein